jgi:hypothetical protein
MIEQLAKLNEVLVLNVCLIIGGYFTDILLCCNFSRLSRTLTVFPLICLDRYINHLNDSGQWQDLLEKINNQLFVEDGNSVPDHLLLEGNLIYLT